MQTFQNLGIAIIHSLWQIGLVTLLYFFILLTWKKLSINHKYNLGLISFIIILFSFVFTFHLIENFNQYQLLPAADSSALSTADDWRLFEIPEKTAIEADQSTGLFAVGYYKLSKAIQQFAGVIGALWILGLAFFTFRKIVAYKGLRSLRNNKHNIRSIKWQRKLEEISAKLNLKKRVEIIFSPFVNSPLSFGFLKPVVLFPLRLTTGLSNEEIKCILIHELAHNLRNDYLFNIFQNAMEVLFFYHPGIWWISKNIRTQREILCDKVVLDNKISEGYYAHTLLKLGELQLSDSNLAMAARRNNNELFTRIKYMINKPEAENRKGSNSIVLVLVLLIFMVSGYAFNQNRNIGSTDFGTNIERILSPYEGSFALYDLNEDIFYLSDDNQCNTRYPAYSTFKIASSLIALDMGIAKNENYIIPYDSLKYPLPPDTKLFKSWLGDQDLKSAVKNSVNWYFVELGEQIGNDAMADYMKKLDYGNQMVSSGPEQAWYNGQLKISTVEQVGFIKDILTLNCKGISKEAQRITKELFPGNVESNYALYGKTGTGQIADKYIGWYVGFLETKNNTYVYALNTFADDIDKLYGTKRQEIVTSIFTDLGLID